MTVIVRDELQPETMKEKLWEAVGRRPLLVEYTGEDDEYTRFEGCGLPHKVPFLVWSRQDEGIQASTFVDIIQRQAAITVGREFGSALAPLLVTSVSLETGLDLSWETEHYTLLTKANEDILLTFPESEGRLESLAREFGISLGLVRSVWRVLAAYITDDRPHLQLDIDRLVDPESGVPLRIVFEVSGSESRDETRQIWDELEGLLEREIFSQPEGKSLLRKVAVHVHRGSF